MTGDHDDTPASTETDLAAMKTRAARELEAHRARAAASRPVGADRESVRSRLLAEDRRRDEEEELPVPPPAPPAQLRITGLAPPLRWCERCELATRSRADVCACGAPWSGAP